jgi:two-component system chemotaxis response regulator CheB
MTGMTLETRLVLIVSDIGGPPKLHELLSQLPQNFRVPILVVQSVDVGILEASTAVLERTVQLEVAMLDTDTDLRPGHVYFARPGVGYQVSRTDDRILLAAEQRRQDIQALPVIIERLVEALGAELSALFLSGRRVEVNLPSAWSSLDDSGAGVIVLDPNEAEVADLGRQVLVDCPSAAEMNSEEIVNYLLMIDSARRQSVNPAGTRR